VSVTIEPGETREIVMLLGAAEGEDAVREIIARNRTSSKANHAVDANIHAWDERLRAVKVKTPSRTFDLMLNRWSLYQALSCRMWARTALYQSSGAFGFRDQLQDVMAFVYADAAVAREHVIRAASRQFVEGDVQHWWHPQTGRGVRTRFSDDLVWLPYVIDHYINVSCDRGVFDVEVPYLTMRQLNPDEHEVYEMPKVSTETGTIYDHCVRALRRACTVGVHGLPLIGSGDWNDGMNRVGHEGRGESVWLGWFLTVVLKQWAAICDERRDTDRALHYRSEARWLTGMLELSWDGNWYRRAYFDDGTPLGSARNEECRIDSIAQSWSVISGASDPYRMGRAMAAVEEYLIRRGDGLVILFTPPFDKGTLNPGYIKGYVPGVRENGGQYTHAAIWTLIAYALLGDGERAGELFALLNPVNHSSTRAGLHKYKVEPYAAVGDVYAVPPHTGRGGWTWYTGSAGWMYRAGLESILGFKLEKNRLQIDPCVPRWWREFEITYRRGRGVYRIKVENPLGVSRGVITVELDGAAQSSPVIDLTDEEKTHIVRIMMGEPVPKEEKELATDIRGQS